MRANQLIGSLLAGVLFVGNFACACAGTGLAASNDQPAHQHEAHNDQHGESANAATGACGHADCEGDCSQPSLASGAFDFDAGGCLPSPSFEPDDLAQVAATGLDPPLATPRDVANGPPGQRFAQAADTPVRRGDRLLE